MWAAMEDSWKYKFLVILSRSTSFNEIHVQTVNHYNIA